MTSTRVLVSCAFGLALLNCQGCKGGEPTQQQSTAAVKAQPGAKPTASSAATRPEKTMIPAPTDVAEAPKDSERTPSGLALKVLTPGTGTEHPGDEDRVKVHYTGWTKDGQMFDSSVERKRPAEFRVNGVIKGWTEALKLMVAGEKRRLWIPAGLAYGETAAGGRPAGQLTFDVELIEIIKAPAPPAVPEDLKAPPKGARKTASGLSYRVLQKGTGTAHPTATNTVRVQYSGWTLDGKMFDSSVTRGQPATFPLNGVIKGWTEGVQLMVVGEKARFWIPGELAYGDTPKRPGAPAGPLVFDIELVEILADSPRPAPPGASRAHQ